MVPTQISCRLFSPTGFFFWPPSDSSSCVNCRSALSLVLRLILRSCNRLWYNVLLLLLVLGLNCQNKPNGFSSCCVLRGGAEIIRFILILIDWGTAQTSVMDYNNLLLDNNNLLPDYNGGYNSLGQSSIIISYKLH